MPRASGQQGENFGIQKRKIKRGERKSYTLYLWGLLVHTLGEGLVEYIVLISLRE